MAGRLPSPSGGVTPWQFAIEVARQNNAMANRDAGMAQRNKETVANTEFGRQNALLGVSAAKKGKSGKSKSGSSSSSDGGEISSADGDTKVISSSYLKLLEQSDPAAAAEFLDKYEHVRDIRKGNSIFFELRKKKSDGEIADAAKALKGTEQPAKKVVVDPKSVMNNVRAIADGEEE